MTSMTSRRVFLAGVITRAIFVTGCAPAARTVMAPTPTPPPPPPPTGLFEQLLGPVKPVAQWTATPVDTQAANIIAGKPVNFLLTEPPSAGKYAYLGPNYYDRIAWAYRYAAASGRQDILDRAR